MKLSIIGYNIKNEADNINNNDKELKFVLFITIVINVVAIKNSILITLLFVKFFLP